MARSNAKNVDLDDLDTIMEELDSLDLDGDEELDLDTEVEDDELDVDDDEVTVVTLESGEEVEITEEGLSDLKKPELLEIVDILNEDGYSIEVAKNARTKTIVKAILAAEQEQGRALEVVGKDKDKEPPQPVRSSQAPPTADKNPEKASEEKSVDTKPNAEPSNVSDTREFDDWRDSEGKRVVLLGLRRRADIITASDMSDEAKRAALEELQIAEHLISLFLD